MQELIIKSRVAASSEKSMRFHQTLPLPNNRYIFISEKFWLPPKFLGGGEGFQTLFWERLSPKDPILKAYTA